MMTLLPGKQRGFTMMEVLITMLIILIGLLGIAALQTRAQMAELESYQRAQALLLMSDIVDRINLNRETLPCFRITTGVDSPYIGAAGAGHLGTPTCSASSAAYNTQAINTLDDLDLLLQGSAETIGGPTNRVGAMIGARACISYDAATEIGSPAIAGTGLYTIAVSWQGLSDLTTPTANCANGLYGAEAKRRTVSTTMRVADLY